MSGKRRQHSAEFKAKVALEACKEQKTINQLASEYEVHPVQISQWKKQLMDGLGQVFKSSVGKKDKEDRELKDRLYRQIGQLQVENDWLKKKSGLLD